MNCPKCDIDLWKATISYKHRIAGSGFIGVNLNCSKCGYNVKAYVINQDLAVISSKIKDLEDKVNKIVTVTDLLAKNQSKIASEVVKKKRRFKLF